MNRRATLGMSFSELVMVRIGHLVGLLCLLIVLPVLPFVALAAAASAAVGADRGYEPSYRPSESG